MRRDDWKRVACRELEGVLLLVPAHDGVGVFINMNLGLRDANAVA
jgi:hypothetical protein